MATRMIRSRADWKKAWTEDEIYNQFIKDNPQYKTAARDDVINAYLEQRDENGTPRFEAFEKSDTPLEYLHKAASRLAPDAMRYIGDTVSGVGKAAGGAVQVAAGLVNPFQAPEARLQTLSSVVEGVKAVPDVAVAAKNYVQNRFAGIGAVLGAIDPVSAVVRPDVAAENRRLAAISPVLQNVRDTPVQMAGDVASVIDVAALPLRAAPVAAAATLRGVGRNAPGRIGAAAEAASKAPVLSTVNEAGQALSRVSNAVDPLTAPFVAAHTAFPGKMQQLRQSAAEGIYRRILNPPDSMPREAVRDVVEEGLASRVPISHRGLGEGKPLPPEYQDVNTLIRSADREREAAAMVAANTPGLDTIDIAAQSGNPNAPGMQGLRKLWDRFSSSHEADNVKKEVFDTFDKAMRSWTGTGMDPKSRPVPGSGQNPSFDATFRRWDSHPANIPIADTAGTGAPNALDIRKQANSTLADYRAKRAREGAEAMTPDEEALSIILKDIINEPFFRNLDSAVGLPSGHTRSMGKRESIHIQLRDAIDRAVKAHDKMPYIFQEQPYYPAMVASFVAGVASGHPQMAAGIVASIAAIRTLYKNFPDIASRFAIDLMNKNPDPAFWRGVLNHVRVLDKANRQPPRPQESTPPPTPPSVQAKPAAQEEIGPGDFR